MEYNRQYRLTHKPQIAANSAKRRARKLTATPIWTNDINIVALYKEAERLTENTKTPHEVDHIIPLQRKIVCGLHCEANLQIIHKSENQKKGNTQWPHMP